MRQLIHIGNFRLKLAAVLLLTFALSACQIPSHAVDPSVVAGDAKSEMLTYNPQAVNSAEALKAPYVILISIDGYRWDYNKLFSPPNLMQIARDGVQAESLKPVYPSKTFPNHYSLITGLNADHHGIVSNEFYDPSTDRTYSLPDRKAVEDGTWYFGEPLWVTAGKQGMLSASFFWVGSEADILSAHPNFYYRYNDTVPYETRVDQVLAWLKLPPEHRPHFITLYFESVDAAAHHFGVQTAQTKEAVMNVDAQIGRLRDGIRASGLEVNLVIVSDHGMSDLDAKKVVLLDETPEAARVLAKFQLLGRGPQMLLYLNRGENPSVVDEAYRVLSRDAKHYRVWKREQMAKLNYASSPRAGDLIIEPDLPYLVGVRAHPPQANGGNHGWDPKNKIMHGIFYAIGPQFQPHTKLSTFENVDVYPLVLEVLGLKQRVPIDGQLGPVKAALRKP